MIILYLIGTFLASLAAVCVSFIFPTTLVLQNTSVAMSTAPSNIAVVLKDLVYKIVDNPLNAIATGNYIGILAWAIAAFAICSAFFLIFFSRSNANLTAFFCSSFIFPAIF